MLPIGRLHQPTLILSAPKFCEVPIVPTTFLAKEGCGVSEKLTGGGFLNIKGIGFYYLSLLIRISSDFKLGLQSDHV